jgi:hypothetical protein
VAGPATPAFLVTGASPAMCSEQNTNAVTYRDIASLIGFIYMHIVLYCETISEAGCKYPVEYALLVFSDQAANLIFALANLNCKK